MSLSYLYRCALYLLGMVINFLGVALIVKSAMGAGFWAALFTGMSQHFGLTVGIWYGSFQFVFIFVNSYLLRRRPEYGAIIPLVLEGIILDFWLEKAFKNIHLTADPLYVKLAVLALGVVCVGLGVAIYIVPGFPRAPVDQLFLAFSERFNWSIGVSQTVVAVMVAGAAFLIGGPVGIGTAVVTFSLGTVIQFWHKRLAFLNRLCFPQDMWYSAH
ncbi:YczE/YyaS/YitT family protein [Tuberibacillus sp. Marseille-P3662]|uniref:YczE/YyaS/YitT family protein n=1 Tax=Tuberibacillus sp. Marseille-P3662 TaxID=1965358 RepID=UPI000A1CCF32|nr:hypothetical protein [Tuberibacillus sp. Marseille-P3662]